MAATQCESSGSAESNVAAAQCEKGWTQPEMEELREEVRRIREEVGSEPGFWKRVQSKRAAKMQKKMLNLLQQKANGSLNRYTNANGTFEKMTLTADSGASDTVLPKGTCEHVPTEPSPGSVAGVRYEVASGETIPNEGQKHVEVVTEDGQQRKITMQVCDVNKALLSIKKTCRAGHRVVFDDDGSFIENKASKERTWLREENGVYTLDVWVKTPF